MKQSELDRALGPTPAIFTERVGETLRTIKEEPTVYKKPIRRTLIFAVILLLAVSAAIALAVTQGQDWYYHNRFTAYQNNEPEKQQAILGHLTTDIPQEQAVSDGLVSVTVQDVSWAPADGIATLSFAVRPLHPESDELYSLWNLDEDGSYSDVIDPEDPDSRTEHWLWTDKGYGPPAQMMVDPAKQLLLFDDGDSHIYIGTEGDVTLPQSVGDQFQGEDGSVICVMEFDLNRLVEAKVREENAAIVFDPTWGVDEKEWNTSHEESLQSSLEYAAAANAAIAANTDENGMLTLRYQYNVVPLKDNTLRADEAAKGEAVFQIKVK